MQIPKNKALMTMGYERVPMRDFLVELEKNMGVVSITCQNMRIGKRTYYHWRDRDEWFRQVSDEIKKIGKANLDDIAELGLINQIRRGDVAAIIFYLKTRHQDYMTKRQPENTIKEDTFDYASCVQKILNELHEKDNAEFKWQKNAIKSKA